jgi:hypothetical protein
VSSSASPNVQLLTDARAAPMGIPICSPLLMCMVRATRDRDTGMLLPCKTAYASSQSLQLRIRTMSLTKDILFCSLCLTRRRGRIPPVPRPPPLCSTRCHQTGCPNFRTKNVVGKFCARDPLSWKKLYLISLSWAYSKPP